MHSSSSLPRNTASLFTPSLLGRSSPDSSEEKSARSASSSPVTTRHKRKHHGQAGKKLKRLRRADLESSLKSISEEFKTAKRNYTQQIQSLQTCLKASEETVAQQNDMIAQMTTHINAAPYDVLQQQLAEKNAELKTLLEQMQLLQSEKAALTQQINQGVDNTQALRTQIGLMRQNEEKLTNLIRFSVNSMSQQASLFSHCYNNYMNAVNVVMPGILPPSLPAGVNPHLSSATEPLGTNTQPTVPLSSSYNAVQTLFSLPKVMPQQPHSLRPAEGIHQPTAASSNSRTMQR
jgi:hypothetical protein